MQKVNSAQYFYYRAQANKSGLSRSHCGLGEQKVFGITGLTRKPGDDGLAETDTHYPSTISLFTFRSPRCLPVVLAVTSSIF